MHQVLPFLLATLALAHPPAYLVHPEVTAKASFGGDYIFPSDRLGDIPTLRPVLPDTLDLHDINNLTPCKPGEGHDLHYLHSPETAKVGTYAIATPKWKSPSVVLDHSAAVRAVLVSSGHLVVYFISETAFEHAIVEWDLPESIVFVAHTPGCEKVDSDDRCYYESSHILFDHDELSATISGNSKVIHDVTHEIALQWGDYAPAHYAGAVDMLARRDAPTPTGDGNSTWPAPTPAQYQCSAPVDTKYGLPTACWGYSFDDTLDNSLGFYGIDHFEFGDVVADIALEFNMTSMYNDTPGKRDVSDFFKAKAQDLKRGVQAGFNSAVKGAQIIKTGVQTAASRVESTVSNAFSDLKGAVKQSFDQFKDSVKDVKDGLDALADFVRGKPIELPFSEEPLDLTLPRPKAECEDSGRKARRAPKASNQTPRKTKASKKKKEGKEKKDACEPKEGAKGVESPWGDKAVLLKSFGNLPKDKSVLSKTKKTQITKGGFLNIYCVSCGVTGALNTKGSIIFGITGITGGKLEGTFPNLAVGVGIGVYGEYVHEQSIENKLYDIPLSPFTIGFATIGPILSVGTHVKMGVKMSGNIHARADVKFTNPRFSYDFGTKAWTQEGWTPEFVPGLSADAQIELTAGFGIPIGLELALVVGPCNACKGSIGIATEPTLEVNATVAIEAQLIDATGGGKKLSAGIKAIDGCKGVTVKLGARNHLFGVLNGFFLGKKNLPIHSSTTVDLKTACVELGKKTKRAALPAVPYADTPQLDRRQLDDNTTTVNSSIPTYDLTDYVASNLDDLAYVEYYSPEVPYTYEGDDEYFVGNVELLQSAGKIFFSSCNDGNVYMQTMDTYYNLTYYQTCTTLWAGYDETIISTAGGDFLHYYNNTMAATGVSRLRVSNTEKIPDTSVYVALTPLEYDTNSTILAAFDLNNNLFFPVLCTYTAEDQGARIFLVNEDVNAGIAMLKSPDVAYSVTAGQVKDCQLLFLGISERPDDAWATYDPEVADNFGNDPLFLEFNSTVVNDDGELDEDYFELYPEDDLDFEDVWNDDFYLEYIEEDLSEMNVTIQSNGTYDDEMKR